MNSRLSVKLLRVFLFLSFGPMMAALQAQSPPAASPEAPGPTPQGTGIDAVPLPNVAEQADETTRLVRDIRRRLPAREAMERSEKEATALDEELSEKLREVGELATSSSSLLNLRELERYWRAKEDSIAPMENELNKQLSSLSRDIDMLEAQKNRWQATLKQIEDPAALPAIRDRIHAVLTDIQSVRSQIQHLINGYAGVENRISRQNLAVADALDTIARLKEHFYDRAFSRDSVPLWAARSRPDPEEPSENPLRAVLMRDYYALKDFLTVRTYLFGLCVLLLVTLLVARRMNRNVNVWIERGMVKGDEAWLFKRPSSLLSLPGLFCLLVLSSRLPFGIVVLISSLLVVPVLRLLPPLVDPVLRPLLFALGGFYLLNGVKEIVPVSKLLSRELSAVGAAAVIAVFVWLTRPSRVHKLMAESAGAHHAVIAIRIALVLIAVSLLANIFGYVAMANVLGQGTLFSAYLAVVLSTVIWVAGRAFTVLLRTEPTNRLSIVQFHRREIVQWFTRIVTAVLFIAWLATTLEIFGFWNGVVSAIYSILGYEIKIGALGFTVGGLLLFLLILAVGFVIARLIRFVLEKEILSSFSLQRGLSTLISTTAYYVVLLMGFMLALAAAGIELSSFTVLTGAFGVGIGFGLQNIFNNFVSGIILLFERPVQPGDIVEVGGMKGEVRNIGLRASTIRTSLGAEVIVPNSNLISNQVINWTDSKRRIDLEVKVVHGADPAQVVTLMKEAAISNPAVVQEPEPVAVFQGFGEKTLNFELRFWAPDSGTWLQLKSDVAVSVAAKLREAGIYTPSPQPDGGSEGQGSPEGRKQELGGSPDSWTNQARLSRRNS